jgi:Flp pilus assembly pilin Flp
MNLFTYLRIRAFGNNDKGQDLLEYALLVALIAVVAFGAVQLAGTEVKESFEAITDKLSPSA